MTPITIFICDNYFVYNCHRIYKIMCFYTSYLSYIFTNVLCMCVTMAQCYMQVCVAKGEEQ